MSGTMAHMLFQKSLQDLVKGIRANKNDPSEFIAQAMNEIKRETKSTDPNVKSQAVRKLTYLQMIGYDVNWACFFIIEVMSQPRFAHKRVGYLGAAQIFNDLTEVTLLTVNLFKKEFAPLNNPYEIGMAINACANIATTEVARDCITNLVDLMNHEKAYVRKRAVLAMYKMYLKYPRALRLTFDKLKDRLEDTETPVVSCAVNVICELANKNAKNYLSMAPIFFSLLTKMSNNWMLIKVAKLLGSLVPEEPRLARKLLDPLIVIIQNTSAKSLQYECIHTIGTALLYTKRDDGTDAKNAASAVRTCAEYLKGFIEDSDQNLKYLGLVGLAHLMRSHPKSGASCRDVVLRCLQDADSTIQIRALELIAMMVTKKLMIDMVEHLLTLATKPGSSDKYRDAVVSSVLSMGSADKYSMITDFAWYQGVLVRLVRLVGSSRLARDISSQMVELALRVEDVRSYAVECALDIVLDPDMTLGPRNRIVVNALEGCVWIIGEYFEVVLDIAKDTVVPRNDDEDEQHEEDSDEEGYWIDGPDGDELLSKWRHTDVHIRAVEALLNPRVVLLPTSILRTFIQALQKMFFRAAADGANGGGIVGGISLAPLVCLYRQCLGLYLLVPDMEVRERSETLWGILHGFNILPNGVSKARLLTEASIRDAALPKSSRAESKDGPRSGIGGGDDGEEEEEEEVEVLTINITPEDESGAAAAVSRASTFAALLAEDFYAVHPKAQRRVPVPEGLNLDAPLDVAALEALSVVPLPAGAGGDTSAAAGTNDEDESGTELAVAKLDISFTASLNKSTGGRGGDPRAWTSGVGPDGPLAVSSSSLGASSSFSGQSPAAGMRADERRAFGSHEFSTGAGGVVTGGEGGSAYQGEKGAFFLGAGDDDDDAARIVGGDSGSTAGGVPSPQQLRAPSKGDATVWEEMQRQARERRKRTGRRRGARERKGAGGGGGELNTMDVLPAGAISLLDSEYDDINESDEASSVGMHMHGSGSPDSSGANGGGAAGGGAAAGVKGRAKGKGTRRATGQGREGRGGSDGGLENVDITTPLHKHERLEELRHRSNPSGSGDGVGGRRRSHREKGKKDKKKPVGLRDLASETEGLSLDGTPGRTGSSSGGATGGGSGSAADLLGLCPPAQHALGQAAVEAQTHTPQSPVFQALSPLSMTENAFAEAVGKKSSRWGEASARLNIDQSSSVDSALTALAAAVGGHIAATLPGAISLACRYRDVSNGIKARVYILAKRDKAGRALLVDVRSLSETLTASAAVSTSIAKALSSVCI